VFFKHVRNTYFFINAVKKVCEKHILLKQHVFLTCQGKLQEFDNLFEIRNNLLNKISRIDIILILIP
jgi:hypothetical protein